PLLAVVLAAATAAGCGGGGERVDLEGAAASEPPSTTATTPAPTTTALPTTTTTRAAAPTTTTTRPRTTTTAARPKPVVPQHGQRVVAVFVVTGASLDEPSFDRARARLRSLGYSDRSGGDTACMHGAKEALPQLEAYSLWVEFVSQADAQTFAALYGTVVGIASVGSGCLD
ncbi:MAG: hypothetical protein ACLGI3_05600, partial [Actinomycetes bacterium]